VVRKWWRPDVELWDLNSRFENGLLDKEIFELSSGKMTVAYLSRKLLLQVVGDHPVHWQKIMAYDTSSGV